MFMHLWQRMIFKCSELCCWFPSLFFQGSMDVDFPGGAMIKNPPANAGNLRNAGSIPGSGRYPAVGNGNSLQYCCLRSTMDRNSRDAWWLLSVGSQRVGQDIMAQIHRWMWSDEVKVSRIPEKEAIEGYAAARTPSSPTHLARTGELSWSTLWIKYNLT